MSIEALIFDVDGTLADTEEAHRVAFNRAFDHFGLGWNWDRLQYRRLLATTGGKERIAARIAQLGLEPAERRRLTALLPDIHALKTRHYTDAAAGGALLLRVGVVRLMEEALASGCRLAIATTTSAENVDALLHATLGSRGLDRFSVISCGDQVLRKKPAPDIYLLALRHLGLPANRAAAVEDSYNGLRSAVAAGLWTVVTPTYWSEGDDFSGAGLVLPSLGDPASPLPGEPGRQLRRAAWLRFDELAERAAEAQTHLSHPAAEEHDAHRR